MSTKVKKVLVLLDVMIFFEREIFRGIKAAANSLSEETCLYVSSESNIDKLREVNWDVVIVDAAQVKNIEVVSRLAERCLIYSSNKIPVTPVNVSTLILNNEKLAVIALGKFIDMGIRKVAFYSNEFDNQFLWSAERRDAFLHHAEKLGLEILDMSSDSISVGGEKVGVMGCTDRSARSMIQALAERQMLVPTQVSVIGVDCDPIESEISPVSITSINISPFEIGKQAASIVFSHRRNQHKRYTSFNLVERASCTSQEHSDGIVRQALFYIYNHFQNGIKVSDVAEYCRVSRKTLDNRFFAAKQMTVHQYIAGKRLQKCKRLLRETSESIEDIALQCGYPHQSYLYHVFKKSFLCTPLEYRKKDVEAA